MKEVYEFLKNAGTWYLATSINNEPHVRPMGFIHIYNDKLYFLTGLKKDMGKQLLNNPIVEISGMYKGEWIRLNAKVVLDESLEAQKSCLDAMPSLRSMYSEGDGNIAVFYLKDAKATFCSFVKEPRVITF